MNRVVCCVLNLILAGEWDGEPRRRNRYAEGRRSMTMKMLKLLIPSVACVGSWATFAGPVASPAPEHPGCLVRWGFDSMGELGARDYTNGSTTKEEMQREG